MNMHPKRPRDMALEEMRALPEVSPADMQEWGEYDRFLQLDDSRLFKTNDGRNWETVKGPDGRWYRIEVNLLSSP